ncbi:MAG: hypothetical protein PSN04_02915 [Methyloprofundus sp.]|nr:hypothetical protein [Methyloprofundus sp.]
MKIEVSKRFVRDTQKITDKRILNKIHKVLSDAQNAEYLSDLNSLEGMAGHSGFYRIKFDYRYRIGVYVLGDNIQFLRVGNRESFYKKFP